MQVVHIEFMKVICTDYSVFKSLRKVIQEQALAAVTIALVFEKKKSRKNRKKVSAWNLDLKEGKMKSFMELCLQNCG